MAFNCVSFYWRDIVGIGCMRTGLLHFYSGKGEEGIGVATRMGNVCGIAVVTVVW